LQDYITLHDNSGFTEVTLSLSWFLILGLITIIALNLLSNVFVLAKVENDAPSENYTTLTVDSHNVNVLTSKALALGRLGNLTGAIEYIDKALAIQPNDTYALIGKGTALGRLGNLTGAILYYDKALAIDPHYVNALIGKGTALGRLGNLTGAIEYIDKALAIQPNDTYALTSKGLALDNLGNLTGAILYYDKALTIQPNDTYALDNKAAALDNHTRAMEYIDKTLHNNAFLDEVIRSFPGDNIYLHAKVTVNGFDVMADVAVTDEQRAKGLDIKNNLTENQGMLFVFEQPDRYGFWMKGMKFPIDIVWLDSNGTVTHIEHGLKPCPPANSNLVCPIYFPEKESLYVLETVPGFSMKHNLRLGTHVSLELVKSTTPLKLRGL
jgi:uncharacterized membrane protein (UPF0127 family)/Tfp pilus assembly protein PilF